jgi:hypothetical protein
MRYGGNRMSESGEKAPETLRWDKTSRHRFAAYQARLLIGVLAYNLLRMLRQFHPYGRRSATVNGVADQASDQGLSEGAVSWSKVVRSGRCGVSFGPTLPRSIRVTSAAEEMVN